jgi:hypothetical protein
MIIIIKHGCRKKEMKTAMFSSIFSLAAIIIVFSPAQTSSADDINTASSL